MPTLLKIKISFFYHIIKVSLQSERNSCKSLLPSVTILDVRGAIEKFWNFNFEVVGTYGLFREILLIVISFD